METLTFTAPDGRVVGTAQVDATETRLPRALLDRAAATSAGELAAVVVQALIGHRLVTGDPDLAAAILERGATLIRASSLMVLTLPPDPMAVAEAGAVELGPLRDAPFEYGDVMRRAYPPGHPDHEHGEVTAEGAAATIRGYLSGEIVGPLIAEASAEARLDGVLVGFVAVSEMPTGDRFSGPWITDVFVDPAAQGHGVGRVLFGHAIDRLSAAGREGLGLAVSLDNPARHLYETLGFVEQGTRWNLVYEA